MPHCREQESYFLAVMFDIAGLFPDLADEHKVVFPVGISEAGHGMAELITEHQAQGPGF